MILYDIMIHHFKNIEYIEISEISFSCYRNVYTYIKDSIAIVLNTPLTGIISHMFS